MYDIKECSSSAHLYNKYIASAEAYTDAKYSHSAADLKTLADYAFAWGINEFVICASAYQPWLNRYPGNTGGEGTIVSTVTIHGGSIVLHFGTIRPALPM